MGSIYTHGPSKKQRKDAMEGQSRVVIEGIQPQIDGGEFAVKRIVGDTVVVDANVFADGHDVVVAVLRYRPAGDTAWTEIEMTPLYNDEWRAEFVVDRIGRCEFTVIGWVDRFRTWHRDLVKRAAAGQATLVDLLIGAELIADAAPRASGADRDTLEKWAKLLASTAALEHLTETCDSVDLKKLMTQYASRDYAVTHEPLPISVLRERAGFSAWYEMFPRSAARVPGEHGTLADVTARLPYIAEMGFDVLYLPPIHPIGTAFRKGKNNSTEALPDDAGSPWAIGSAEGGHKAIHPELGTLADFHALVAAARERNIEIALDIALQCSPDHPYAKEHPDWFRQRPDGTIQYAENPPKKYQDIYPFDFESADWRAMWDELKSIFDYWIAQGVRIFRVDNPHTKPFGFWQWCLGEINREHPEVIFLAEAFTRPKIMYRLAKLGYTHSYTYFTWRNTKQDLTEYLTELASTPVKDFFFPNFWPNTPDILNEYLQQGGRAGFMARLVLAATLSPNYGIYGPPFEHCWGTPAKLGSEEYLDSEKYEVRYHDIDRPDSLSPFIAKVNRIRREHAVFKRIDNLRFHSIDNDSLICYSKTSTETGDCILVVVNLDPHQNQGGWLELPLAELGLLDNVPFEAHDLLSDVRYEWTGSRNWVNLHPDVTATHIFQLRRGT